MSTRSQDWTAPGVSEVIPGVHRIPLPLPQDGLRAVNAYALVDGKRVVLIDAGWALAESEEQLAGALDQIGYGVEDVAEFLVTHAHRDHYTQAVALRRRFGSRISLGAGERPSLEALVSHRGPTEEPRARMLELAGAGRLAAQLRRTSYDRASMAHWELPDRWLQDRTGLKVGGRTLESIETPGHTRGHLVYLDRESRVLFAGDHVLPHITPSIGFEQAPTASPLADYLTSLALLRDMPDAMLLPGHGPVTQSVHQRVDELLAFHEERLDASLAAIDAGAHTAYEVAGRLGWTRRRRALADLDLFNATLAILETVAHLEVLVERGLLRRVEQDDVRHYLR